MEKASIDIRALQSLHRFGDIFEQAALSISSEIAELQPLRQATDSIGRHWYGMRCAVTSRLTGQGFYLHMGLIYLPETRVGLMVEVDRKNNLASYEMVWNTIADEAEFGVNREEAEYLKLFMPDSSFAALSGLGRKEQAERLARYIQACVEAIVRAADTEGFRLEYAGLNDAYRLALQFEAALEKVQSDLYTVEINRGDPDNFGQYASGYRYYLRSTRRDVCLYAYFGGIYSYKKAPAGIFAEIDWLSNQKDFHRAFDNMEKNSAYLFSRKEPKFIKLFLPPETQQEYNASSAERQVEILAQFLDVCNTGMITAATK